MIDYDHQQDGSLCNGNLSIIKGKAEAHWTFDGRSGAMMEERLLTVECFALLWDGIAASVRKGGVFGMSLVTDPTRLADAGLCHVVTTTQVQDGLLQHRTFMVPTAQTDPAFLAWLELLVPSEMRNGPLMPVQGKHAALAEHAQPAAWRDLVPA